MWSTSAMICVLHLLSTSSSKKTGQCSIIQKSWMDKCVMKYLQVKSWVKANEKCNRYFNGRLIELNSIRYHTQSITQLLEENSVIWVGATVNDHNGAVTWSNGDPLRHLTPAATKNSAVSDQCVVAYRSKNQLEFRAVDCSAKHKFICQYPVIPVLSTKQPATTINAPSSTASSIPRDQIRITTVSTKRAGDLESDVKSRKGDNSQNNTENFFKTTAGILVTVSLCMLVLLVISIILVFALCIRTRKSEQQVTPDRTRRQSIWDRMALNKYTQQGSTPGTGSIQASTHNNSSLVKW